MGRAYLGKEPGLSVSIHRSAERVNKNLVKKCCSGPEMKLKRSCELVTLVF